MSILDNITSLRRLMSENGIDAYLIYGTDPHLSEYVPAAWRSREWISGFSGSYGKVAISQSRVSLWTDSRYFIQAEMQLSGTGIEMIKDRQADTISVDRWMGQELKPGSVVATDGLTISAAEANALEQKLSAKGITLKLNIDLVSPIWENRPSLSQAPVYDFPVNYAGRSRKEKLAEIRNQLIKQEADATLICQLDDVAWTFNLRGSDINYNPLFTSYGYIDRQQAILFIMDGKVPEGLRLDLEREGVRVINYESIYSFLEQVGSLTFYLDPERTNSLIYRIISKRLRLLMVCRSPRSLNQLKTK